MPGLATDTVWRGRLDQISSNVEYIDIPEEDTQIDQDEEWCYVTVDGRRQRVQFHDYSRVFNIPGLYEELFYDYLQCCSPSYLVNLLEDVAAEAGTCPNDFRVLDVGAGNGMVGDELHELGVASVVGVDILDSAKNATLRDRPDVYDDYRVTDLTDLPEFEEERLRRARPNCLTTVAALGFGDIPPLAFAKALDLLATPSWLAFNIKEDFLDERDSTGFSRLVRRLCRERYIRMSCYRRYRHRLSMAGEPLYYVAMIAEKRRDLDTELLVSLADEP